MGDAEVVEKGLKDGELGLQGGGMGGAEGGAVGGILGGGDGGAAEGGEAWGAAGGVCHGRGFADVKGLSYSQGARAGRDVTYIASRICQ